MGTTGGGVKKRSNSGTNHKLQPAKSSQTSQKNPAKTLLQGSTVDSSTGLFTLEIIKKCSEVNNHS
jgi:hypothetical protein